MDELLHVIDEAGVAVAVGAVVLRLTATIGTFVLQPLVVFVTTQV
jgi:hypothetical protein